MTASAVAVVGLSYHLHRQSVVAVNTLYYCTRPSSLRRASSIIQARPFVPSFVHGHSSGLFSSIHSAEFHHARSCAIVPREILQISASMELILRRMTIS
ncbi:hypothetical protein MPTK1_2g05360 [Marchantia polymorpha subsp. ruderalis]|uniref:Uncharacterized protein n=1 Tax=Marchantia polymorpha TaxID=3197 RepID=A0A2R6X820_MARPO|nr:hypothetical protein MARPO_0031s0190 [Marchantia polymorpha]BBN01188.1 hypothetical protein Mp_2g05360 [Marchantia polymorpha subsp. ruderalis]|eukprot:PTQ42239.1 hypothetical protein MARPO_0031s0190 [Marchantia polymorpha]